MQIKVFYHVYIPDDLRACAWTWYVDEQLKLIYHSKLYQLAQVYVCVTMPAGWINLFGSPFQSNDSGQIITFAAKLHEYLSIRYPWAILAHVRDTSLPNVYEGIALHQLWMHSQTDDFLALYIHTKGVVVQSSPSIGAWREILNHYCIEQWPQNVRLLENYQVVAVQDAHSINKPIVSGNFFWTRSDYVRGLDDPLNTQAYAPDGIHRYCYELWILSKEPTVYSVVNTQVNHYGSYCFLEDLKRKSSQEKAE